MAKPILLLRIINKYIMFYNLKDKLNRYLFFKACRPIFITAPITATTNESVAVLTQLQHKDVLLFLIAIKTFVRQVPLSKVFIINDFTIKSE